jgi:hypothetical protein
MILTADNANCADGYGKGRNSSAPSAKSAVPNLLRKRRNGGGVTRRGLNSHDALPQRSRNRFERCFSKTPDAGAAGCA